MLNNVKLSIIIPSWNTNDYIETTIKKLYKTLGKYKDKTEVLIIDDGSDKPNYENIKDADIYYIKHGGPAKARNVGIKKAKGEWITFLDADDEFVKKGIKYFFDNEKSDFDIMSFKEIVNGYIDHAFCTEADCHGKFFRKKFISDNKIKFLEGVKTGEDTFFYLKSINVCNDKRHIMVNGIVYNYRHKKEKGTFSSQTFNGRVYYDEYFKDRVTAQVLACCEDNKLNHSWFKRSLVTMFENLEWCVASGLNSDTGEIKKENIRLLAAVYIMARDYYKLNTIIENPEVRTVCEKIRKLDKKTKNKLIDDLIPKGIEY